MADQTYSTTFSDAAIDWRQLAWIMERAPLFRRDPERVQRAFQNSYRACFAFRGAVLVGAARATSDGVFYATVFDVVVAPEHQGRGVGRLILEALLAELPFERVFLTAVPGKEGFYGKFGFLRQTNAMGCYAPAARATAMANGVLVPRDDRPGEFAGGTGHARLAGHPNEAAFE